MCDTKTVLSHNLKYACITIIVGFNTLVIIDYMMYTLQIRLWWCLWDFDRWILWAGEKCEPCVVTSCSGSIQGNYWAYGEISESCYVYQRGWLFIHTISNCLYELYVCFGLFGSGNSAFKGIKYSIKLQNIGEALLDFIHCLWFTYFCILYKMVGKLYCLNYRK